MTTRLLLVSTLLLASAGAQTTTPTYPLPTPAQQKGIDGDIARHFGDAPADPGPLATDLSPALTPAAIDKATRKVADWELAVAQPNFDHNWTWAVLYDGFLAASDSTGDAKYRDAMTAMATQYNWAVRSRMPGADDQSIGQVYLDLYFKARAKATPEMIAPLRTGLDSVIDLPTVRPNDPRIPWWWCDALFMAPPVWVRMSAATHDHKYIDYMNTNWQRTSDLLYDKDEHLYARDATYIPKRGPNGKKIFWSRGEGWVMGGIVRTLEYLPADDPHRPFYIQQLREMSARVLQLQRADGLWPASLLDPEDYPLPEVSGSALMLYAMAWGVNEGILDAKVYKPAIAKGWAGLLHHVYADGRLGCIEQTGAEPAYYLPGSSFNYGVGGYLLAASEIKRMVIEDPAVGIPVVNTDPAFDAHLNLPVPKNPKLPSLILVGDSTVRNGRGDGANNQMGWGEPLVGFFDTSKINVVNRAIGGLSSRTYITQGHWADTLPLIKRGDVVLIQFGHNDAGAPDEPTRARASLPGIGDETAEIQNPLLHRHETVHTFGWYLTRYIQDVRARGGKPILCTLVPRKIWQDGKIVRNADTYAGWTRQVAAREHVPVLDLNEIIARRYDALGPAAVEPLFGDPHTHTTLAGATINAESVVSALKALPSDPVTKDFSAAGKAVPRYAAN
jgi:rhamnogalacturonyl hydrolase YesR/lysophospholipase L1-like esterase